ncbi:hypothetical protein JQC91_15445 [Jannaschia sp. Os4]|uniref:hypothetical protein n=1 Tax=Jannaschia sp. Os4 TaxID=2807617 RepID=UPI001939D2FA|nr:hypothetical protein [Jannaschia sp. Os4]MBM2577701.1 hypothetical protein [Jannaschia sp. Os4]
MRALLLLLLAAPAAAWTPVAEVEAALAGRTVDYDAGAWQRFDPSGATLYHAGAPSWGRWAARGGAYCSEWPPADGWVCYRVEIEEDRVRFVDDRGGFTEGTFRE